MREVFVLLLTLLTISVFAEKFPYRSKYPSAKTIETSLLKDLYDQKEVVIIDVRSEIEYEVIHPKEALHIPMSKLTFVSEIQKLKTKNPEKKFVFYCNGVTCLKAYEATKKMVEEGMDNVFAYDGGVPDWAEKYPKETLLLGKVIENPKTQLIPKSKFKERCLDYKDFTNKFEQDKSNVKVFDVRDFIQAKTKLPDFTSVNPTPMKKFIESFVTKGRFKDKTLLIYDQVGKQVRWLMYYLKENGYKNYYFLKDGVTGVVGKQEYKK